MELVGVVTPSNEHEKIYIPMILKETFRSRNQQCLNASLNRKG